LLPPLLPEEEMEELPRERSSATLLAALAPLRARSPASSALLSSLLLSLE
jgi:hypothetical protein